MGQEIQQNIKINRLEQCRLHPSIHTSRSRILPQDMVAGFQRKKCRLKYVIHIPSLIGALKKRSRSSASGVWKMNTFISRVAEGFHIRSLEQRERPICHCILCCTGNKFPHQSRKSPRSRLAKMILCSTYKEVSL